MPRFAVRKAPGERRSTVALVVAVIAVFLAGTGTAVAAAQVVSLADGTDSTLVAQVDSLKRLRTAGPSGYLNWYAPTDLGDTVLSSPTKAALAISHISFSNPARNSSYANTNFTYYLERITVGATGKCTDADAAYTIYAEKVVPAGQTLDLDFQAPLLMQNTGNKAYCLGVYVIASNGTDPTTYYLGHAQVTGYVAAGTYSGTGTNPPNANLAQKQAATRAKG